MANCSHLSTIFQQHEDFAVLRQLVGLIRRIYRKKPQQAERTIQLFIHWLTKHAAEKNRLSAIIISLINKSNTEYIFSESGLPAGGGFFDELNHRLAGKFLPDLLPDRDIRVAIRRVFYKPTDHLWINKISNQSWMELFALLLPEEETLAAKNQKHLLIAGEKVSYQIAALGLNPKITRKTSNEVALVFTQQNKDWVKFTHILSQQDNSAALADLLPNLHHAILLASQQVQHLKLAQRQTGTSLQQSYLLERLQQLLERLSMIITILDPKAAVSLNDYVTLFKQSISNECTRNKIRVFFAQQLSFLAFRISEHGSYTGEKYITSNKNEYWQFFKSAAKGGVLISFAAMLKILLTQAHLPYFWASFAYGFNYALAFVCIHLLKGTIATKQPALTASTLANHINHSANNNTTVYALALLNASVFRSQLISLAGNLVVVLPLTILLAVLFSAICGHVLIPFEGNTTLLQDVQPRFLNAWFAIIAGVLLFASGIISGYFDNLVIYGNIGLRLRRHRLLKKWMGIRRTLAFAKYIERNLGAIMGNILLGFGLGFMIFFGKILGLPLDIRHVTISTGYLGFAWASSHFALQAETVIWCMAGLAIIAFFNLFISFSLALYVALKSRKLSARQLIPLFYVTMRYFWRYPMHFIHPKNAEITPEVLRILLR